MPIEVLQFNPDQKDYFFEIYVTDGIIFISSKKETFEIDAEDWKKVKDYIDRQLQ